MDIAMLNGIEATPQIQDTSAEAGAMLFLSPKTIDTYRSRMMHELDTGDLASLVKFAIQHGITQLD
jgi:two-component system invasion response regulator UvrY